MSDFKTFKSIERLKQLHDATKNIAIEMGANPEAFDEADKVLNELYESTKQKISGGFVTPDKGDESGEFYVRPHWVGEKRWIVLGSKIPTLVTNFPKESFFKSTKDQEAFIERLNKYLSAVTPPEMPPLERPL